MLGKRPCPVARDGAPLLTSAMATHDGGLVRVYASVTTLAACGALLFGTDATAAPPGTILAPGTVPQGPTIVQGIGTISTTPTSTGNRLTIEQIQSNAILNWQKFNIGAGSEVLFNQRDAGARVLNRIFDADPSIIQGKLTAKGQVFLLNRNGILFDRGSQVNVATLLASSLNLKDEDFLKGFASGAGGSQTNPYTALEAFPATAFSPAPSGGVAASTGPIMVGVYGPAAAPQAQINVLAEGAIVLIAPRIENRGIITSPDGQVILAAGEKAYLWQRNTENTSDTKAGSIRGLMVEVGADNGDVNITSLVRNFGDITADRGNVSIAALAINQSGRISAGSSVVRNGSIWLTARSIPDQAGAPAIPDNDVSRTTDKTGTVYLAPGSVTQTPLLVDSGRLSESDGYANFVATTVNADNSTRSYTTDFRSWIHIVGNRMTNAGSIIAPGGTIDLLAIDAGSRILLSEGSLISAAGNWVDRQMSDNVVEITRLTSNDLQDAPIQKDGPLLGAKVFVDIRKGSPLFDISKQVNNLQRTVQDRATVGGAVRLESRNGDVVAVEGSTIDVSGGGFRYASGSYATTKLLGADGKIYDIADASPLRTYAAVSGPITRQDIKAGPTGWNITHSYRTRYDTTPSYETAYVEGKDAGSLSVIAPTVVAQGDWRGGATLGRYQVKSTDASAVPHGGVLTVGDLTGIVGGANDFIANRISFGQVDSVGNSFGLTSALPDSVRAAGVVLSGDQFRFAGPMQEAYGYLGFATLNLYANESISVPAGTTVSVAPGGGVVARTNSLNAKFSDSGTISLAAGQPGLAGGSIVAPAGRVSLDAPIVSIGATVRDGTGNIVAAGANIDAGGTVSSSARPATGIQAGGGFTARAAGDLTGYVESNLSALLDDAAAATGRPTTAVMAPAFARSASSSGSIAITGADVQIGSGATLSAMGGFHVGADNSIVVGSGGEISINVPVTRGAGGAARPVDWNLLGFSLGTGGKIRLASTTVDVRSSPSAGKVLAVDDATGALIAAPEFFQQGGFTDFRLTGSQGANVESATSLAPYARGMQLNLYALRPGRGETGIHLAGDPVISGASGANLQVTGGEGARAVTALVNLREKLPGERAPTSVSFRLGAPSAPPADARLTFDSGAQIRTDPGATVEFVASGSSLTFDAGMDILGRIYAPGGTIRLTGTFPTLTNAGSASTFDPAKPDSETQSGSIVVGATAMLSTAGTFITKLGGSAAFGTLRETDDSLSYGIRSQGSVTSGGKVAISAVNGRVSVARGSLIDVSGIQASVDLPTDSTGGPYAAKPIWGDAGSIELSSTEAMRVEGDLRGNAAGAGLGGSFSAKFTRHSGSNPETDRQDFDHRMVVAAGALDSTARTGAAGSGAFVTARISADSLNAANFSSISLRSDHSIEFSGTTALRSADLLSLDAPILATAAPAVTGTRFSPYGTPPSFVTLDSQHVTLMNSTGNPAQRINDVTRPVVALPTERGNGRLTVNAGLIDLIGSVTVQGLRADALAGAQREESALVLNSKGDIRLTGLAVDTVNATSSVQTVDTLMGALVGEGNIQFNAQQIYPTSMSDFTIASRQVKSDLTASPGGVVRVTAAGGTPGDVLSAGGTVHLEGARVVQSGTIKAPLGTIDLNGTEVSLENGSLTSVSLAGLTVPLGETVNGREWIYDLSPVTTAGTINRAVTATLTAPASKRIITRGTSVDIARGATLDLQGGGDVQAFQFVAGPGGSRDVLQTTSSAPTWAILPSMRLDSAPVDTHLSSRSAVGATATGEKYNTIHVIGSAGLADGDYPLLDAHYALLPGAYQVSALSDAKYKDIPGGIAATWADGTKVIATYRGVSGSDAREARTSGYLVRSGTAARRESEFTLSSSGFFSDLAQTNGTAIPRLPVDAGSLVVAPTRGLQLDGTILSNAAAGGRSAMVDISAELLEVVDQSASTLGLRSVGASASAASAFVLLDADKLSAIKGSILLGGTRTNDGVLQTTARQVIVSNSSASPLQGTEIMLAATERIELGRTAVIDASQNGSIAADRLATRGDGAFLRAASDGQLQLQRSGVSNAAGDVAILSGATVTGKSINVDSTRYANIDGALRLPAGGALSLSAGSVGIGQSGSAGANGLSIDAAKLATFSGLGQLAVRSYSYIDLIGDVRLGSFDAAGNPALGDGALSLLTLDAREITGRSTSGSARIAAQTVALLNSGATRLSAAGADGGGTLDVAARRVILGAGDKGIRGFGEVRFSASEALVGQGMGTMTVDAPLAISAPRVVAGKDAVQVLSAASYDGSRFRPVDLSAPAGGQSGASTTVAAEAGGRWTIEGQRVTVASVIDAPAGRIDLAAHGNDAGDGVTLKSGANLSVAGVGKAFSDTMVYASAGQVSISATSGDIDIQSGAKIDVSAKDGGGDAGRLKLSSVLGAITLSGDVRGNAASSQLQGSADIDAARLPDLAKIDSVLNAGNLVEERTIRLRQGDLKLVQDDVLKSKHVALAADAGSIVVQGTVDASGPTGGGRVELYANQDLTLSKGSLIDVRGTSTQTGSSDPYSNGGQVELVARNGKLALEADARIDVSSVGKGDAGRVTFAVGRDALADPGVVSPTADPAELTVAAKALSESFLSRLSLLGTVEAATHGRPVEVVVRGDRSYDLSATDAQASLTTATTRTFDGSNPVWADYKGFMEAAADIGKAIGDGGLKIRAANGTPVSGALSVRAGIEVRSVPKDGAPADLLLSDAWDLTSPNWNLGGIPGLLTLRASGNLDIANALGLPDVRFGIPPRSQTWSLRLAGGADLGAANPLALTSRSVLTASGSGDVIVRDDGPDLVREDGTQIIGKVRTGTGSIDIAAGRDVRIGSELGNQAVVYAAGMPAETVKDDPYGRYLEQGGSVRILAQREAIGSMTPVVTDEQGTIVQAGSGEFINDWLRRSTLLDGASPSRIRSATAGWWAYLPNFRHNIGSFGGGNLSLAAGESIRNLSAVSVTSGRASREESLPDGTRILTPYTDDQGDRTLLVRGGGDLSVRADGNIVGGEYLVSLGQGQVRAGGSVGTLAAPTGIFLMGQGSDPARDGAMIRIEATGSVRLQNISNPTILTASYRNFSGSDTQLVPYGFGASRSGFFSYSDKSRADVLAVTGDLSLVGTAAAKPDGDDLTVATSKEWSTIAPSHLLLAAMQGSVQAASSADGVQTIDLYPSTAASFRVLAGKDIRDVSMRALNVAPESLPVWNHPGATNGPGVGFDRNGADLASPVLETFSPDKPRLVASASATEPRYLVEALQGDVVGNRYSFPERATIRAGKDIIGSIVDLQNLAAGETSTIIAGRDISQGTQKFIGGEAIRIAVAGPGTALVQAGRNIDLGNSIGFIADGNTRNSSLKTSASARLLVAAGVTGTINPSDIDAMMPALTLFGVMEDGGSAAMARDARAQIRAARAAQQSTVALDALAAKFSDLATNGRNKSIRDAASVARSSLASVRAAVAAGGTSAVLDSLIDGLVSMSAVDTTNGKAVNDAASAAGEAVAKAALGRYQLGPGIIDMFASKVQTTGGSGIDLLAPGVDAQGRPAGTINAGLPSGSSGNVGIITQTGGAIRSFLSGDFNVNQSKVLTSQGGDILLYSSGGSIDAGRGALTSRSSSPPRRVAVFNDQGEQIGYAFLPPIDVAGSGIRTVTSDPDGAGPRVAPSPGSIYLFAPKGTINAGEAGIDSAGDVTIRALAVFNSNAITAAGSSSGVPPADTGGLGALASVGNLGSNTTKATEDATKSVSDSSRSTAGTASPDSFRPSFITVEVLGFGDEKDDREKKDDRDKKQ